MSIGQSLREKLAIVAVRCVNWMSRVSGRGAGTVAGGRVGLWIDPSLLSKLASGRTIVLVSGTNGKTTTTALCAAGWGGDVATNVTGSNMPPGHVAALVGSRSTRAVLEADEAWLDIVVRATRPSVVVLLNLSRDQLDRASEVRQMAERWHQCLAAPENAQLVVVANANDPLVAYAAMASSNVRWCDVVTSWMADARSCPRCTLPLEHTDDDWHCSSCGFAKPTSLAAKLDEVLHVGDEHADLDLSIPGQFNRANATLAAAALAELGVGLDDAVARMNNLSGVAGRFSLRRWGGHTLRLLLAKNPAGFDALLSTVGEGESDVWVAINAQVADGHDPSWLYDVAFERLRGHRVWCLGERRLDLATRLDYAGVDFRIVDDLASLPNSTSPVEVLANYTAFSEWMARTTPC
jgi:UDP-N-acetylmuramyl tripeptide synthase